MRELQSIAHTYPSTEERDHLTQEGAAGGQIERTITTRIKMLGRREIAAKLRGATTQSSFF